MELLIQLQAVLSETIMIWKGFDSTDGDIGYFADVESYTDNSHQHAYQALRAVKEAFEQLESLQRQLDLLQSSLTNSARAVS
jgi:hypothetical protein